MKDTCCIFFVKTEDERICSQPVLQYAHKGSAKVSEPKCTVLAHKVSKMTIKFAAINEFLSLIILLLCLPNPRFPCSQPPILCVFPFGIPFVLFWSSVSTLEQHPPSILTDGAVHGLAEASSHGYRRAKAARRDLLTF